MKKYVFTLISFIISISCLLSYNIIGSEVAADGTLVEPFYLIPMAYLFLMLSIIIGLVTFTKSHKRNIE